MDYKGHFPSSNGARCHPLTALDDDSRFALVLKACADEREQTVRAVLTEAFRRYGLPAVMLMDNGSPWGAAGAQPFTAFSLWLIRLGIRIAVAVLIIRRPRARTSASIARSSSSSCATSTSPAWSTASASSIPFATATTCSARTTRSALHWEGEQSKRESRGLASRHQADDFGAAPFDFGAMPICHRRQVVMNWAVVGRECERYFGFARGPFLAA